MVRRHAPPLLSQRLVHGRGAHHVGRLARAGGARARAARAGRARAAAPARRVGGARDPRARARRGAAPRGRGARELPEPGVPRGVRLLSEPVRAGPRREDGRRAAREPAPGLRRRRVRRLRERAVERARVLGAAAARVRSRWATAPMPALAGAGPGVSLAGGASLGLVATSDRKAEAWAWIAFLAQPSSQAKFHRLSGNLPASRSAWDDAALQQPQIAAFRAQLANVRATPKLPEWERIASRIAWHAENAVREGRHPRRRARRPRRRRRPGAREAPRAAGAGRARGRLKLTPRGSRRRRRCGAARAGARTSAPRTPAAAGKRPAASPRFPSRACTPSRSPRP